MPSSRDDLEQLKAERDAADRAYNEALTRLDRAIQQLPPEFPHPPPGPDEHQITPLNSLWKIGAAPAGLGLRGRFAALVRRSVAPLFEQQQAFNAALVEHVNRNVAAERQVRESMASTLTVLRDQLGDLVRFESLLVMFLQQITPYVDTRDRDVAGLLRGLSGAINAVADELMKRSEAMRARDHRRDARVDGVETTIAVLQQQLLALERASAHGPRAQRGVPDAAAALGSESGVPGAAAASGNESGVPGAAAALGCGSEGSNAGARAAGSSASTYFVFEEQFRGSSDEVRRRMAGYVDEFAGVSDVVDVGCGRGEFLSLLRERGIAARGVDSNPAMVAACRAAGLDVTDGDAVAYLSALADSSLGGVFSAQVVEHLAPDKVLRLIDVTRAKLKPGGKLVIETINPACWTAFFDGYLRDFTHVQPVHPDTLRYLLQAGGFHRVDIRFSAPFGPEEKLRQAPAAAVAGGPGLVDAFNANVDRLNGLLFTHRDYAAIGERL